MSKSLLYRLLSILLSFALVQSQVAMANPKVLEGVTSPERQPVYIDPSPSSQGKKVYSIIPGENGKESQIRRGVIENGKVTWSDGSVSTLKDPNKGADSLRPSRVIKYTSWDKKRSESMKSLIERLKKGDRTLLQEMNEQNKRSLESNRPTHSKTAGMTQVGISFYLAMGVLAYFELSTNYANNPNAWSDYADSLNDPIGWLMLPAFILATHKIFKYAATMKGWKAFGVTSAGMAVGLIATTVLGKILYDPNFKLCMGFTSYSEHGRFERDEVACDRLYDAWAGEELFLTIVPLIGHAVMAGGIVASVLWLAKLGLNATQLAEKIKVGASFLRKPKAGGLISIASGIGSMVLFFGAFHLSYQIVDLETSLRDFFLVKYNPFHDEEGSSLSSNMQMLHQAFEGELKGETTNFENLLGQHQELMTKWRNLKFSKVNQAYQAWNIRSDAFADMAVASYLTYRDFLTDLTMHRQGEIDMTDPSYEENLKLNSNQLQVLASSNLDYEGIFKNIMIRDHYSFLLTSMACGPDTKPTDKSEGFFASIKSMISSEPTPSILVTNERGQKAMFYPPRLVDAQEFNVCSMHPMKAMRSGYKILDTLRDYTPEPPFMSANMPLPPNRIFGVVSEQKFNGLLDYLIKAVPEHLAPHYGESQFEDWWAREVVPSLEAVNQEIEKDYIQFLNTTYREVLTSDKARCITDQSLPLFRGVGALLREASVDSSCPETSNFRLGEGLSNSINEQVALYFHMTLKLLKRSSLGEAEVKPLMLDYLYKSHRLSQALAEATPEAFGILPQAATEFVDAQERLMNALDQVSGQAGPVHALALAVKGIIQEGLYFQEPLLGEGVLAAAP